MDGLIKLLAAGEKFANGNGTEQNRRQRHNLTPYYIDTSMFADVRSPFIPIFKAEYVADRIIAAVNADRIFLLLPWIIYLVPLMRGILPVLWYDEIGVGWMRIYHSMDNFRGLK